MKQENRIKIFEIIRDLPYKIGPLKEGEELLKYGRGGCGPKNRYLAKWFYDRGYKVKICWTLYDWKDLKFLSDEIKNHPKANRIGNHVYIKVYIDNKWTLIDASWDKDLTSKFPVNLNWDGKSNQVCATKIIKEKCMNYPEPYLSWRKKNKKPIKLDKFDKEFSKLMNNYLEQIRKNN